MVFVKKFCCFELRTGVITFGAFASVYSVLQIGASILLRITDNDCVDTDNKSSNINIGSEILGLVILISLTYGAYKESRKFLLPYLIVYGIFQVLIQIFAFYIFINEIRSLVFLLMVFAFFWYIWLCVFSLYQMLDPNYTPNQSQVVQLSNTVVNVEEPPPSYDEVKESDV